MPSYWNRAIYVTILHCETSMGKAASCYHRWHYGLGTFFTRCDSLFDKLYKIVCDSWKWHVFMAWFKTFETYLNDRFDSYSSASCELGTSCINIDFLSPGQGVSQLLGGAIRTTAIPRWRHLWGRSVACEKCSSQTFDSFHSCQVYSEKVLYYSSCTYS